ncbi:ATP-binding protein [Arenimonas sp. MALMAid1274]|uniref:hybrid sensor histidine kinase/response regulator n=1 Tax=Arenimonas sp. MALMAid1274 TaxID=3411630 RepID=UPI003BA1B4B3
MAAHIRAFDWSTTSLGPIAQWSPALRNTVEILLASGFPMALRHGPDHALVCNDAYARLVGVGPGTSLALSAEAGFGQVGGGCGSAYQRALAGETVALQAVQFRLVRDGEPRDAWFDASVMPWRDEHGRVAGCLTLAHESTDRVLAQQGADRSALQLREGESRFRMLFDAIDEGFCLIDMIYDEEGRHCDYRFALTNVAFERQTGFSDPVGRTVREFLPDHEPVWYERYGQIAEDGVPQRFELRAESLGRWYDVYAFRIGDPADRQLGVLFNDVSERRAADAALRASEAQLSSLVAQLAEGDRRKNEFIATLAHELRNPLAPLTTATYLLGMEGGDPDGSVRAMITRQVQQMARLVDDLLDVSRITRGQVNLQRARLDLVGVVRSAVETSAPTVKAHSHQLELQLPATPVYVDGDETRLAQVVQNLINNAAKYTPRGGRIDLSLDLDAGGVRVIVQDNGAGLPADALESIFGMFTQLPDARGRAQGGLGIGLALARRMAELHGGTLHAESEGPGQGSRFVLRLPLMSNPDASPIAEDGSAAVPAARRHRVLVVDDNRDAANSLARLLQVLGHEVRVGYDGPTGLALAEEFHPQLGLFDIGMPDMDGHALARAVRAQPWGRTIRLAAVSGWGQAADRELSQAAGFYAHLAKPVTLAALQRLLDDLPDGA